ncbi:DUF948 domain-containing protein [Pseudalkalibacillus caeni]|nr:DUF948 domain-containing protein [Pseudalkalibacillus caeni]
MIIVYISIGIVVAALLYLGFSAYNTFKSAKPALNELSETAAKFQKKTEAITEETNRLSKNQQQIKSDIKYKKQAVKYTVDAVKQTPEPFKELWQDIKTVPNPERINEPHAREAEETGEKLIDLWSKWKLKLSK